MLNNNNNNNNRNNNDNNSNITPKNNNTTTTTITFINDANTIAQFWKFVLLGIFMLFLKSVTIKT